MGAMRTACGKWLGHARWLLLLRGAGADEEEGALKKEVPLVAIALFTPLDLLLRLCASCRRLQRTAATHCV
jgi:hypothetical protein